MHDAIIVAARAGPFELFAVGSPLGEIKGIILYIILPAAIGTLVTRLMIHLSRKRTTGESSEYSPWTVSVMMGALSVAFLFGFFVFYAGNVYTPQSILWRCFFAIFICSPIIILHVFWIVLRKELFPAWSLYLVSVLSLVSQYFWLMYALNG